MSLGQRPDRPAAGRLQRGCTTMAHQHNSGFSFIELTIVLAIAAILVAFAIPFLQEFLVRARVAEGLELAANAKSLVTSNAQMGAPSLTEGWVAPGATRSVSSVAIADDGLVTITYTAQAGGGTLLLTPAPPLTAGVLPSGTLSWICGGGTLYTAHRPPTCR
jgi:type IV pilus assembly protein PilA